MSLRVAQPHLEDGSAYRQNRPTQLDKIQNFRHHLNSGDVISLSPDLAVKLTAMKASGQSSSGWNSVEAHVGSAWVLFCSAPLTWIPDSVPSLPRLTCEEFSWLPDPVLGSVIPLCSQERA